MPLEPMVRPEIARRYFEQSVVEEMAERYREKGFKVEKDGKIGKHRADLIARKGKRTVVVEVKAANWSKRRSDETVALRNYAAHQANTEFKLVWASQPRLVTVDIARFDDTLRNLLEERLDDTGVTDIATVVTLESIIDWELAEVSIKTDGIDVRGTGTAEFELQYGSGGGDDGMTGTDLYPFTFHITLDGDLNVSAVSELSVDVSSFYE